MSGLDEKGLRPCPFCGGAAEIERHGTARQSMIVACQGCGARMESGDVSGLTKDLAWNRRAATALERITRERDEARATLDEVCLSNRQEWQRATSAEAKLAEARKVIEELRVASEAFLALAEDGSRLHKAHSTSGRFLEETK